MADGIWIVGPSRSGTSMVAGLFAAHGVFFGKCMKADENNQKGYFENLWLKREMRLGRSENWPRTWFSRLRREGWDGESPWGAKGGPEWWKVIRATTPAVIVLCYRPFDQIMASRRRHTKMSATRAAPLEAWRLMGVILREATCPVVMAETDLVRQLVLNPLVPAFAALGLELSMDIAKEWIDPTIWNRGITE